MVTYLNSLSESITCTPCSYCSLVPCSPTDAKWPFMARAGAVSPLAILGRCVSPFKFVLRREGEETDGTEVMLGGSWRVLVPWVIQGTAGLAYVPGKNDECQGPG